MSNQTAKKTGGSRFSTSLVVGMLLVPLSAVAAVALVNPDASAEPEEVAVAVVTETTTTMAAEEIIIPEIASGDDLELACGEQGLALVIKEADATISPLEQAALDSLRAICVAEGMELPGPPAPEAVVQTVTVVAAPAATGGGADSDTDAVDSVDAAAAEFEAQYAATVAHINKAIADGAGGEKIAMAERLVGEAAALADSGHYDDGMAKLAEARKAADEAGRSSHDDDDDDDDDGDHEDDEDDDHDDHEEDEEDEKDDH